MSGDNRTEKPTPKRLREARREGRVAKTQDLGAWGGMLLAGALLPSTIAHTRETCLELLARADDLVARPDPASALALLGDGMRGAVVAVAPLALGLLVLGVAANAAQGGVHIASKQAKPQLTRLNPMKGLKRAFGPQGLWEGAKALLKSVVLGVALWRVARAAVPQLLGSGRLPLDATLTETAHAVLTLLYVAAGTGLALAAADYLIVRRRVDKGLRMSRKEITDEMKQSEGDPHVKGAIRSRMMAMSRNRMMAAVASADVVLVNPTHVAVALRYDPARGAPRVVAKGAGAVAARIRERAEAHRVPMVEHVPLARALYAACRLEQEIPAELYTAVARVLAFVMTLRRRGSASGLHKPALALEL